MNEFAPSSLYQRISNLRWLVVFFTIMLIVSHQIIEFTPLDEHIQLENFEAVYVIVGSGALWWVMTSLRRSIGETEMAEHALQKAHGTLAKVNKRLTFLIDVNHRLAKVEDEEALITMMLELPREIVPAVATSLVSFDQHQQRLPTIYHHQMEPAQLEAWSAHLVDHDTRQQCASCEVYSVILPNACPLLQSALSPLGINKIHCLPLGDGRAHSVLNIYLQDASHPTPQEQLLLDALAHELTLALESQRMRTRELEMLTHIQRARQVSDLHNELTKVLEHTINALEVSGGALFLVELETGKLQLETKAGRPLTSDLGLIHGIAADAWLAEDTLIIRDLEKAKADSIRSLLAAPVRTNDQALGSLLLWDDHPNVFTTHRSQLVSTVAGQAALLVANQRLFLQGEYRAARAERARLAREIHDGLAQALGYLKLRTIQIINWLQKGEEKKILAGLMEVQKVLNDTYVNTREAIDGLHLTAQNSQLEEWFNEMLSEFETVSDIQVKAAVLPNITLPHEVQAQLQRIVLEALNNIRKHACATAVRVEWHMSSEWLTLQIYDDGIGFDLDDVLPIARHGTRIMRERAELLEADFHINSQPGEGTQVTIRLPLKEMIHEATND